MAMSAQDFMARLREVRVAADTCPEPVQQALQRLTGLLKDRYSPDALKAAMATNEDVPTDLEEAMTTLYMTFLQHRQ